MWGIAVPSLLCDVEEATRAALSCPTGLQVPGCPIIKVSWSGGTKRTAQTRLLSASNYTVTFSCTA